MTEEADATPPPLKPLGYKQRASLAAYVDALTVTTTMTECVHLCQYLSNVDELSASGGGVDIGLAWSNYSAGQIAQLPLWTAGACHMVNYKYRTQHCTLMHLYAECTRERKEEGVGIFQLHHSHN